MEYIEFIPIVKENCICGHKHPDRFIREKQLKQILVRKEKQKKT